MRFRDEVTHILRHVNAEAQSSRDPDVARRANKIRNVMNQFRADNRELTRSQMIDEFVRVTSDSETREVLTRLKPNDPTQRIRLTLQDWVENSNG